MECSLHPRQFNQRKTPGQPIQQHVIGLFLHPKMPGIILKPQISFALEEGFPAWTSLVLTAAGLLLGTTFLAAMALTFVPGLPLGAAVLAGCLVPLGTVIPLRGIGGFGNIEALWAGCLYCFGAVPPEEGFVVGLGIHVVGLLFAVTSGLGRTGVPKRFDSAAGSVTITPE